jgi:hypothetical protein
VLSEAEFYGGGTPRGFRVALSAMQLAQSRLLPARYREHAPKNLEECLATNTGLCGRQVQLFLWLVRRAGLRARCIQLYRINGGQDSHIIAEVFFNDKWNLFDVTWGSCFRRPGGRVFELRSFAEVRAGEPFDLVSNQNNPNYLFNALSHEPLGYLRQPATVVLDGVGTLRLSASSSGSTLLYSLEGLPKYIGVNHHTIYSRTSNLRWELSGTRGRSLLLVRVSSQGGSAAALRVAGGGSQRSVELHEAPPDTLLQLDVGELTRASDTLTLSVEPLDPQPANSYLVIERLALD